MTDPASGTVAAVSAVGTSAVAMMGLGTIMPQGASIGEFVWGCLFAMLGAAAYQFIEAFVSRQKAADQNIPIAQRPVIDHVMLGYAMCGAPLSAALLIFGIHQFHGATGFGDSTWLQSAAGFMVVGPAGPKIVIKAVGAIIALVSSRIGGKP